MFLEAAVRYVAVRVSVFNQREASLLVQLFSPWGRNFSPEVICSPLRADLMHQSLQTLLGISRRVLCPLLPPQPQFMGFLPKMMTPEWDEGKHSEAADVEQRMACSEKPHSVICMALQKRDGALDFCQADALVCWSAF